MKFLFLILLVFSININAFDAKFFRSEIPKTDFKDVTLSQAIQALQRKSMDVAGSNSGFNYVFSPLAGKMVNQKVSFSLTTLPLYEAIRYTALVANLKVKFEKNTVLFIAEGEKYIDPIIKDKFTRFTPQMLASLKLRSEKITFEDNELLEAAKTTQKSARAIDPQKKGVNLLVANANPKAKVNLSAHGLSLYSLMKYIAFSSGVKMKMEKSAIVFTSLKKAKK